MFININLTETDIQYILFKTHFLDREAILWYYEDIDPYGYENVLKPTTKRIVYPASKKDKISELLACEHPLLDNFAPYLIENALPLLYKGISLYGDDWKAGVFPREILK